jgi:hypothetical protein
MTWVMAVAAKAWQGDPMRALLPSIAAVLLSFLLPASVLAQPPAPPPSSTPIRPAMGTLEAFVRNWTRVESWSFFEPRPGGGDPDYTFVANRLLAGLRHTSRRHELVGALQYVQFGGLPDDAIGPGPLGTGALYFDHNRRTDSRQLYLKTLNVQIKQIAGRIDVRAGRMPYASGAEVASGDAGIEAVKRMRLDSRLLGEFEWSLYQRAFDGIRGDWDDGRRWHGTAVAFWPTQGGFDERAGRSLRDVRVVGGVLDLRPSERFRRTQAQVFVWDYRDSRPVTGRPDNARRAATAVDVDVQTFGASLVGAYPSPAGRIDTLGWLAVQTGDWYESRHRASAFALEGGHQWSTVSGRPWLRAGWNRASGDADPDDTAHGTFFPMLPTGRKYSLSASYAAMNLDDLFGQLIVRPRQGVVVRADVHRLRLVERADLWYAGSGATRRRGMVFGYAGRSSGGRRSLGAAWEASADWTLSPRWSINGYAGLIRGGEVVRATFGGDRLRFAYVENVIQFP